MFTWLVLLLVVTTPPDVTGKYHCVGQTPNGDYEMLLEVVREEDNYYFLWHDTEVQAKGFGLRVGDQLSAIYQFASGNLGMVTYTISPQTLTGKWTMGDGVFPETCTFVEARKA